MGSSRATSARPSATAARATATATVADTSRRLSTGGSSAAPGLVASLRERRDLVVAGLNAIDGIVCQEPAGAFYAFPRVAALGLPAGVLADRLLADAGVACLPGTAFGSNGEGFLRLSYATASDRLREGLERIGRLAAALG